MHVGFCKVFEESGLCLTFQRSIQGVFHISSVHPWKSVQNLVEFLSDMTNIFRAYSWEGVGSENPKMIKYDTNEGKEVGFMF